MDKQYVSIGDNLEIAVCYNEYLSSKPYLLRMLSYHGNTEYRLEGKELLNLAESLVDFLFDNQNTIEYTGMYRLLLRQRNDALDKIEELETKLTSYEQNNSNR